MLPKTWPARLLEQKKKKGTGLNTGQRGRAVKPKQSTNTKCKAAAAGKKTLCSILVLPSSRASAADNSLQEDCSQVDTSTKNATYILL